MKHLSLLIIFFIIVFWNFSSKAEEFYAGTGLNDFLEAKSSDSDKITGKVSLFDGKSFRGWQGNTKVWKISRNGVLQNFDRGAIFSQNEYGNFVLSFDFYIEKGGNNGLLLRVSERGMRSPDNDVMEIQIADHTTNKEKYGITGSLYGVLKPRLNPVKINDWNSMQVRLDGFQLTTTINDVEVMNTDISLICRSGFQNEKGRIGFYGWTGKTAIRNIKIVELDPSPADLFAPPSRCHGGTCRP